jgi:hypothetical protein
MQTPILGSAYTARSVNAADNRMVNLFPEVVPEGSKQPAFLQRAPGLPLRAVIGTGPIRGLWQHNSYLYVVSGNTFYQVSSSYVATAKGTVTGTGLVTMADNGTQIMVAADPDGYIYNTATGAFAQITDPDFPGASVVDYLDGFFVFIEPNSQRVWVTALLDGTSVDPLDFISAEGDPDNLISMIVDHREVWLFGKSSTEVWYNAGLSDFPLVRIQGAFNELGCAARYSVAKMNNQVYWLGADDRGRGIVYVANGYQGQRISTHAVEWQIQQYGSMTDAIGFTYQQDGHSFYVLVFPTAAKAWVYDASTGAWHERADWSNGNWARYRAQAQVFYNNENLVGDYENGNLYALDLNNYEYNGETQRWLRSWRALPTGQNTLRRTAQHALQLDCETGVGLAQYPGYETEGLATESGDLLIAEYTQNDLVTESGDTLTTGSGDGFETLVDALDYPILFTPPMYLSTTSYLATPGYDPQVMLRWSDDGGHTWSNEHWRSMGKIGAFGYRTIWRRLGMTMKIRDRVYEVSGTDPVKIAIMGAELQISDTNA